MKIKLLFLFLISTSILFPQDSVITSYGLSYSDHSIFSPLNDSIDGDFKSVFLYKSIESSALRYCFGPLLLFAGNISNRNTPYYNYSKKTTIKNLKGYGGKFRGQYSYFYGEAGLLKYSANFQNTLAEEEYFYRGNTYIDTIIHYEENLSGNFTSLMFGLGVNYKWKKLSFDFNLNWLKIKGPSSSLKPDTYDYFQDGYINNYSIGISYDLFYSENENVISDISYVVSGFKSEDSVNKEIEKFNKTTLVKYPPNTLVSLSLSEASKTGYLEASKQGNIFLKLANKGKGGAYALSVKFSPVKINGLTYPSEKNIGDILPNETKEISIPISASLDVESKEVSLTLTFSESNGFPPPPSKITFSTKAFVPPKLEIADVGIEDANGNGKIDVGEIVKVTARIQNTGAGKADDVSATVTIGENIFLTPDSKTSFPLVKLESGEHKDISFSIFANQNAASVPVFVSLTEKHNKFGVSKFPLPLELNKTIPKLQEIVVQGKSEEESLRPVGKTFERASGLSIDIEQNIPETKQKNPNAVALIIAVAEYANKNVPKVEYAKRDAQFIREYLVKTFGYDAKNILPQNADEVFTFATMKTYIKRTLPSYLKKDGSSEVFIYYTGHGAPSTITSEAFFVPQDCDPNFVSDDNAYNMNDFYMDIAKLNAKKKFVVVDACFSGQTGSGQTLVKNASPALLKVKNVLLASENSVLFQSSSAEQVSNWYPEKKHSMFTYFFLKGIQGSADKNNDGTITAEELENFVNDENDGLPYFSNREFQRPQKAVVSGKLESVVVKLK